MHITWLPEELRPLIEVAVRETLEQLEARQRPTESQDKLLVNAAEAAKMLAIGERTLWGLTASGEIPEIRIGRSIRYSLDDLRDWIERTKSQSLAATAEV